MPLKYVIPLLKVSAVAASSTVTIDCPAGPRYHKIVLQHGFTDGDNTDTIATAAANITNIRVKLNGRVQREYSAAKAGTIAGGQVLRDVALFNGTQFDCVSGEIPRTAPGVSFPIYFAEPWRKDRIIQDGGAWPTAGFQSFQIEVDLGAEAGPTLVAWAVVDDVAFDKPQMITVIKPATINASGTKFDWALQDQSGYLAQISLYQDSGGSRAATPVTLRKGSLRLYDAVTASANKANLTQGDMTPAASGRSSIYDIVLDADDQLGSCLPLDNKGDTILTVEAGATMSGTITALIQRIVYPE